jgi:hypothetical protein
MPQMAAAAIHAIGVRFTLVFPRLLLTAGAGLFLMRGGGPFCLLSCA